MSVLIAAVQGILRSCSVNPLQVLGAASASDTPSSNIPDNAIYANGEPIPDPSGGGYLTYGATT